MKLKNITQAFSIDRNTQTIKTETGIEEFVNQLMKHLVLCNYVYQ